MQRLKKKTYVKKRRYASKFTIPKKIAVNDSISVKCEYYDTAGYVSSGSVPTVSTLQYINVTTILAGSTTFTDMVVRYGRFKMTGLAIRYDSTLDSVKAASLDNNYPVVCFAFYPQLSTQSLGTAILANDQKAYFGSNVTIPQTHYWRFPENYFVSGNGGYGTWNNSSLYASMPGQISISSPTTGIVANAVTTIGSIKLVFYVTFSTKNQ